MSSVGSTPSAAKPADHSRHHWRWRTVVVMLLFVGVVLVAIRLALPSIVRWYVVRTINQNPIYQGNISDIELHLWRGAYSIKDVRLIKTTGNVPVPLFAAPRIDLAIEWNALMERKVVGQIRMEHPELNFVAGKEESESQTGAGGPWLQIIRDLFPFRINSTLIHQGSVRFQAFHSEPQVNVYLSHVDASVENLTNLRDEVTPLIATIRAKALAMEQAPFEFQMKLDPSSYYPTFQLAVRLLNLDVTKLNDLSRAYGSFDMERGWLDLVVELNSREGRMQGYVKPLFRRLQILSLDRDIKQDNVLEFFWEALLGVTTELLKNQPRDQFATLIPLTADVTGTRTDILAVVGNVLRNAFIRAYLPRFRGTAPDLNGLEFGTGSVVTDPSSMGAAP